ncbi:MarR family winged helix-turn-helix transcriptional regulator [Sporolactobacillus laevolacticus]|uniref:MarR family transcriptional regulator n=1 Tax=Sporolactobacillus laevolacticus DSM 442 TaxID=1395513 RepID=V6IXJ8_9BACL|nr:MarR family transcriptional regulator [Sporolactobacillus laevolacticus]EST12077.1 MarR family transcriptional regulator [Sporolactobacillus laevolacticus DSM 442]
MKINTMDNFSEKYSKTGLQLWFQISRAYHIQLKLYSHFLKNWDLSISQYEILKKIVENTRISQKELAEKMFFTKGNITQIIIKMEKGGYIRREQEWKTKYILLTNKGKELYEQIVPEQKAYFSQRFQGLTKKEQKHLAKLLKKMNEGENLL